MNKTYRIFKQLYFTAIYLTSCNCPVCCIETSSIECILVAWDKVYEHGISERYIWTWYTCSTNRAIIGEVISLYIVKIFERELCYILMQKAAFFLLNFQFPSTHKGASGNGYFQEEKFYVYISYNFNQYMSNQQKKTYVMFELFLFFMNHDRKRYKTRLGPQTLQLLLLDSFLQIFRGATCGRAWKEVSSTLFWKLKRSAPILGKNTLIVFIYGLNLSLNWCFKSIWEKKSRNFPFGALLSCAVDKLFIEMPLFQETSRALSCAPDVFPFVIYHYNVSTYIPVMRYASSGWALS